MERGKYDMRATNAACLFKPNRRVARLRGFSSLLDDEQHRIRAALGAPFPVDAKHA